MIDETKIYDYIKSEINPYGKPFKGTAYELGLKVMNHIKNMDKVGEWIPVSERLPDTHTRVLTEIRHHEWISDYDSDWVPEEEKTSHPEYTEVCEARYCGKDIGWEYYNMDDGGSIDYAQTDPVKDISLPVDEVIAWMPLPRPYKPMALDDRESRRLAEREAFFRD